MAKKKLKKSHKLPEGKCEICGKESQIIIDGRIKRGPYGPRGHFIFMCPSCHWVHGISSIEDDAVVYQRAAGRYFEIKGKYFMTPDEIRDGIGRLAGWADSDSYEQAMILLVGELAVQVSLLSENLRINNDYIRSFLNKEKPSLTVIENVNTISPNNETETVFDEGELDGD